MLQVGPRGRVLMTLERRTAPLPSVEALRAAVEGEGGLVSQATGTGTSTLLRYSRPASREGLLLVRTLDGGGLLLCASTADAESEELEQVQALCSGVRLEAGP